MYVMLSYEDSLCCPTTLVVEDGMHDRKTTPPSIIFKAIEVRLTVVARFEDDVSTGFRVSLCYAAPAVLSGLLH